MPFGPCHSSLAFTRQHLTPQHKVALEATFNTWAIVALLQPFVVEVVVSNPLQTRAIAQAKVKTDKIDTEVLGHLLHCDYLPRVWIPDPQTRSLRQQSTERANLTAPGVDFPVAETLYSTLGDITRFPSPDRAAAYPRNRPRPVPRLRAWPPSLRLAPSRRRVKATPCWAQTPRP